MPRVLLVALLACVASACSSSVDDGPSGRDAGAGGADVATATTAADASLDAALDAAPSEDAQLPADGASAVDAAPSPDAGPASDAAVGPDSGLSSDAGADSGVLPISCGAVRCYYVRQGASGDGSDWTTAYAALPASLERGATYFVAGGAYPGHVFDDPEQGTTDVRVQKATLSDHGTDVGWDARYGADQATFNGQLRFTRSHYVIDGATGGGPGSWLSGFGFRIHETRAQALIDVASNAADSVTVRHVELAGSSNSSGGGSIAQDAVAVRGGFGFTLSYFYTHAIGRAPFFLVPAPSSVIELGYIGDFVSTNAAHAEVVSAWSWRETGDFTFRYNVITAIAGTGGIMWDNSGSHASLARIYGNVFYQAPGALWDNNANGLIGGWTGGGGEDCFGLRVYNNSFVNTTGRIFTNFITRSGDNEVVNNLFYNSDPPRYDDIQTHDYNLYIDTAGAPSEANGATASGDPFIDLAALDFSLRAATPPGRSLGSPYTTDAIGTLRGADGNWDRGAYERR